MEGKKFCLWMILLLLSVSEFQETRCQVLRYDGEVNIGLLVNLHHPATEDNEIYHEVEEDDFSVDRCGLINVDAVQQVIAAKWAVDVINNQSLPHELNIGIQLHDTCNEEDLTQRHLYHVISATREFVGVPSSESPPILGMIGVGEPNSLAQTSGALQAFNIPLISASPEHAENLGREENVLTTAPDMSGQTRALANLAYEMRVKSLSLISSSHRVIETFLSEATALGIRVPRILELSHGQSDLPRQVEQFLKHISVGDSEETPTVVLIVSSHEAVAIAEHLKHSHLNIRPTWLIGSLGLDLKRLSAWRRVFHRGIFVEPHMPELQEFRKYFIKSLQDPDHQMWDLIQEYKEEMYGCAGESAPAEVTGPLLMPCSHIPAEELELRFQQDPHVSFVVKAVSALTAAFRLVQLDHCAANIKAECLRKVHGDLHEDIQGNLRKLSFSSMMSKKGTASVGGTQHHFTRNGRLVANKQIVYMIDIKEGLESIGWYSEDEGLQLTVSPKKALTTTEQPRSSPLVKDSRSTFARSISDDEVTDVSADTRNSGKNLETLPIFSYESFISRTWALVVVSVAIFGVVVSLWMLVYVFQKISDETLTGSQVMGVLLLFGVMGLFASVIPWLLPPNEVVCATRHFMHPLLLVLCFSILLVKAMQLRSLVTLGLGGSLPQVNQLLSLFFMVMVQVVIAIEWYFASRPIGIQIIDGYPECGVSMARLLLLHIYPTALLLLAFFYAMSVLKVKRNFNEGRWITCATIFIIPIFVSWPVVYYFAPVPFHDPCVAVSVLAVAGILLSAIFLPKMHTIAHQSHLKQSSDMSRTNSDATVYTGFSDYINFQRPGAPLVSPAQKSPMYPIYGYTTNHFVPTMPSPTRHRNRNSKSNSGSRSKGGKKNSGKGFNGLNYVTAPSGSNVKTFAEWSNEYNPHNSYHQRTHNNDDEFPFVQTSGHNSNLHSRSSHRHNTATATTTATVTSSTHYHNLDDEDEVDDIIEDVVAGGSGDDGTPQLRLFTTSSSSEARRRGRGRNPSPPPPPPPPLPDNPAARRRSKSSSRLYSAYLDRQRQRHSQSPSDGMILTAAGLADLPANNFSNNDNSNPSHNNTSSRIDPNQAGFRVSEVYLTH